MKVLVEVEVTYKVELEIDVAKSSEIDSMACSRANTLFAEEGGRFLR